MGCLADDIRRTSMSAIEVEDIGIGPQGGMSAICPTFSLGVFDSGLNFQLPGTSNQGQ